MLADQKQRLNRKRVIWCAVNGRPWAALKDIGLKLILAEFSPEAAASTPAFSTLNAVLNDMYRDLKTDVKGVLQTSSDFLKKHGYDGPYSSLQLDLTTVASVEYITASVGLIRCVRFSYKMMSLS